MSKRKHNIAYIKPEEPKFLRLLKEQAGYKEGPTVDTKRENVHEDFDEDREDREEEQPIVVVLKSGDLSAEEVADIQKKQEEAEANAPADLSKRIIFNKTQKSIEKSQKELENPSPTHKKAKKEKQKKVVLSFDDEEENEAS